MGCKAGLRWACDTDVPCFQCCTMISFDVLFVSGPKPFAWSLILGIWFRQYQSRIMATCEPTNCFIRLQISLYSYPTCDDCFESSVTNINFLGIQNHLHDDCKCKFFIPFIHFSEWADIVQLLIDTVQTTHMQIIFSDKGEYSHSISIYISFPCIYQVGLTAC